MKIIKLLLPLLLTTNFLLAQKNEGVSFPFLGKVKARTSSEIASSNWAIGAETMDRDLVEYDSWKDYIGLTGTKKVRLQAGWGRCEKEKGKYDFAWLDEVVDGVMEQGVEPWLQTSYGNLIYEGGGGIHLSAGLPTSEEALNAWDNWVRTMATRYHGRVNLWEIWNEPDNQGNVSAEAYAEFYIRTAEIIRDINPDANLMALSLASVGKRGQDYTDAFFKVLKEKNKLHLVDEVSLHGYTYNPKDPYPNYEKMYQIIKKYADHIRLRQGELGCPSENQSIYALRNYEWTELSQSKWVVRKMMGDLGRDILSSYFLIIDIVYTHIHEEKMEKPQRNTKGLLKSDLDKNFVGFKESFYSYQNVTSIFDHSLERIVDYPYTVDSDSSLSVFAYRQKYFNKQAVVIWIDSQTPTNSNKKTKMTFNFPQGKFQDLVLVDLRTGEIFEIPSKNIDKNGTSYTLKNIPIYDSPMLVADKSLILMEEKNEEGK
ncbi:GH39 family glycosyl hydrolase [Flexithrix dorotheae]|uniref:GH39 family glycosyl hydrolase n=1 Tax=Flexithrix dorotheae TaxID=70993 RepID=UPI00035E3395|nr:beta-galactosidase [Flexithrix dorotheae]